MDATVGIQQLERTAGLRLDIDREAEREWAEMMRRAEMKVRDRAPKPDTEWASATAGQGLLATLWPFRVADCDSISKQV
jgi:hypothetical protein